MFSALITGHYSIRMGTSIAAARLEMAGAIVQSEHSTGTVSVELWPYPITITSLSLLINLESKLGSLEMLSLAGLLNWFLPYSQSFDQSSLAACTRAACHVAVCGILMAASWPQQSAVEPAIIQKMLGAAAVVAFDLQVDHL
ncbi:hypothetical protein CBL_05510 [Carabus blaptoides fortunei]